MLGLMDGKSWKCSEQYFCLESKISQYDEICGFEYSGLSTRTW